MKESIIHLVSLGSTTTVQTRFLTSNRCDVRAAKTASQRRLSHVYLKTSLDQERENQEKKNNRFFSPREYDQIKRIKPRTTRKRTCVESRFSVVECPRRFATSAIARLFASPRSRWMPFPITLRFTTFSFFSLFFSLFSLSNFFLSLPLLFFRGPSLAFENFYPFAQSHSTSAYSLLQHARDPKFLSDLFRS